MTAWDQPDADPLGDVIRAMDAARTRYREGTNIADGPCRACGGTGMIVEREEPVMDNWGPIICSRSDIIATHPCPDCAVPE